MREWKQVRFPVVWTRCACAVLAMAACARNPSPDFSTEATEPPGKIGFMIEKPAMLLSGSARPPRYPPELLATGDTGTVHLRLVVDKEGRPVMRSVEVASSPHPAFTREALAAVRHYRFLPAEIGGDMPGNCRPNAQGIHLCEPRKPGRKIPITVDLPFVFRIPAGEASGAPPPPLSEKWPS